ncbi:MAG: aminotransferase class I/II-fold pyridoxal phosphate-dependent enzyme [Pseudomonadota bacterium]
MAARTADFSSALYLGLRHPAAALGEWNALTLGKPAALREPPGELALARELALLQGCAAAVVLPSTLHLYWDLFGMLARDPVVLLIDGAAYPIARWGAQRAALLGVPVCRFRHGDAMQARSLARHWLQSGRRPLILADGYCPGSECLPPLAAYAEIAQSGAGCLVLDDTQVLGVLGPDGGGSVPLHGLGGAPVLAGASLAKGFGAPLAVLSGSAALLERFDAHSQTRRHCSPASAAAIAAALRALRLNRGYGGQLRRELGQRVRQFRNALRRAGIACRGGMFPVQAVPLLPSTDGPRLHAALRRGGVEAVLQSSGRHMALAFLLRADHAPDDVMLATAALEHLWKEFA